MTAEEARRILIDIADQMPSDVCADWIDAVGIGIQALEAQPCEEDFVKHKKEVLERIAKREREIDKYIKELETLKQQPSEDCISRKQALDDKGLAEFHRYDDYVKMRNYLKALPSVTPERPKGKWIEVLEHRDEFGSTWHYECSECRAMSYKGFEPLERYCPNCGAEMGGADETN